MPKRNAPESVVFHVRIPTTDRDWLLEVASKYGVDAATVIRWAIDAMRKYVDANNGRVHLPLDFRELWQQVEARAAAEQSASQAKRKEA